MRGLVCFALLSLVYMTVQGKTYAGTPLRRRVPRIAHTQRRGESAAPRVLLIPSAGTQPSSASRNRGSVFADGGCCAAGDDNRYEWRSGVSGSVYRFS
ncbi:hypothetical protein DNTS_009565 [Danionella cerebrum]|uniref:Secreted protein n=1 Tax=Danionella cerebrum TaxID=2873325 RepID=A0A553N115_9TELE|nr:hypothetical protein DNTS_009565 [Danionella translucida]